MVRNLSKKDWEKLWEDRQKPAIIGWGRWGESIMARADTALSDVQYYKHIFSQKTCDIPSVCPSPAVGERLFWHYFTANPKEEASCRIHVVHAGEHLATGALTAYLRRKKNQSGCLNDVGIVFVPPSGSNDATCGRILTHILCDNPLFDACLLLDACAQKVSQWTDEQIDTLVCSLLNIFCIFERTSCMFPLIQRMHSRALGISLIPLPRASPTSFEKQCVGYAFSPCSGDTFTMLSDDFLAFSTADKFDATLQKCFEKNMEKGRYIYIPFMRTYEWKNFALPSFLSWGKKHSSNVAGVFFKNAVSPRFLRLFRAYFHQYWQEDGGGISPLERFSEHEHRWLETFYHGERIPMSEHNDFRRFLEAWCYTTSLLPPNTKETGA